MWVPIISFSDFVFHKKDFQCFENYKTFPKMGFPNGIIQRSNLQHHFIAKQESSGATIWKTIFPGIGHSLGVNSEYPPGGWTIVPNCTTCSTLHYLIAWYFIALHGIKNTEKYWKILIVNTNCTTCFTLHYLSAALYTQIHPQVESPNHCLLYGEMKGKGNQKLRMGKRKF